MLQIAQHVRERHADVELSLQADVTEPWSAEVQLLSVNLLYLPQHVIKRPVVEHEQPRDPRRLVGKTFLTHDPAAPVSPVVAEGLAGPDEDGMTGRGGDLHAPPDQGDLLRRSLVAGRDQEFCTQHTHTDARSLHLEGTGLIMAHAEVGLTRHRHIPFLAPDVKGKGKPGAAPQTHL